MTSNFMNIFNIFCLHQTRPSSNHPHIVSDLEILHSKPIDLSHTLEPSILILQKNIYKIICNIQPIFFEFTVKNHKSFVKKSTVEEHNIRSLNEKKTMSCWDFSEKCLKDEKKISMIDAQNKESSFFRHQELIQNMMSQFVGNFTIIYNYSNDRDIFNILNKQVNIYFSVLLLFFH